MIWQYLILGVILAGAVYYLWRVFFRRSGGGCCGSSCGGADAAACDSRSPDGSAPLSCGCGCGGGNPDPPLAGLPPLPPEHSKRPEDSAGTRHE